MHALARAPTIVLAIALGSCGGRAAEGDHRLAAEAYAHALRSGDGEAAFRLQSAQVQEATSAVSLGSLLAENRTEADERGAELSTIAERSMPPQRAEATLASGEKVSLVLEDGSWKIEAGIGRRQTLRSPEDAVLALRRALQRQNLSGLASVLAQQERAELEAELSSLLDETKNLLRLEIETSTNQGIVRTPGGRAITLVREGGEWRVTDIR